MTAAVLEMTRKMFLEQKSKALKDVDLSRKGSVDEEIKELVSMLCQYEDCFTTSSCSGRVVLIEEESDYSRVEKRGCRWLYVSHSSPDLQEILRQIHRVKDTRADISRAGSETENVSTSEYSCCGNGREIETANVSGIQTLDNSHAADGDGSSGQTLERVSPADTASSRYSSSVIAFRYEPFVLHVQCRSLMLAKLLCDAALAAGFRNSGIVMGRCGRFVLAVRSTHSLHTVLACGDCVAPVKLVQFTVNKTQSLLVENRRRIQRFHDNAQQALQRHEGGQKR